MESVIDIMKSNDAQWRKEWPFDPVVSFSYKTSKKTTDKKEEETWR